MSRNCTGGSERFSPSSGWRIPGATGTRPSSTFSAKNRNWPEKGWSPASTQSRNPCRHRAEGLPACDTRKDRMRPLTRCAGRRALRRVRDQALRRRPPIRGLVRHAAGPPRLRLTGGAAGLRWSLTAARELARQPGAGVSAVREILPWNDDASFLQHQSPHRPAPMHGILGR